MSPLEIKILLHYYACAGDYPGIEKDSRAWQAIIKRFLAEDLLQQAENNACGASYVITPRAQFFVHHLCHQPLPVQVWAIPETLSNVETTEGA